MIELPSGLLPVMDLTTEEILYGSRTTSFRYELLSHDSTTGADSLLGYLDGVQPDGVLQGESSPPVKWGGSLTVRDVAEPGFDDAGNRLTRVGAIDLTTVRIRPVRVIEGLPETPLGVYVVNAAPEVWSGTGRTYQLTLQDKSTVLEQDAVETSFTADTATPILSIVAAILASAGERISVDLSDDRQLAAPRVWEAGTSKLRIVNDLLTESLGYNALWVDGAGNFRATPYVRPALRSPRYSVLNGADGQRLTRELVDGESSIYEREWRHDRVSYKVPNRVMAVAQRVGDADPLVGVATNTNPDSPYSTVSRGRVIVADSGPITVDVPDFSAEANPTAATIAFLEEAAMRSLIARSSSQAVVSIQCLPIPIDLMDAVRFANTPAGVDARHVVRSATVPLSFDGLMSLELTEVTEL